jgi:hypothetical protein
MRCFVCGAKCLTVYITQSRMIISPNADDKIIAVRKDCTECEWHSYPTKVPEPLNQ